MSANILEDLAEFEASTVAEVLFDGRLILPSGDLGPCAQVIHQHGWTDAGALIVWAHSAEGRDVVSKPVGVYGEVTTYARGLPGGAVETLDWWKDEADWWHPALHQPRFAVCLNSGFNATNPYRSTDAALEACRSRLPLEDRP